MFVRLSVRMSANFNLATSTGYRCWYMYSASQNPSDDTCLTSPCVSVTSEDRASTKFKNASFFIIITIIYYYY